MGEIKSTLDLVMEKTRHLTLSDEEKRDQRRKEAQNRLAGLLQRYQDGMLDIRKMAEELDRLLQDGGGLEEALLRDHIMGRMELGSDNQRWLQLLEQRYRIDTAGLRSIEKDFHSTIQSAAGRRTEEIREEFQRNRRISGSAVVPNLAADRTWNQMRQSIAADFTNRLAAAFESITGRRGGA